MCLLTYIPAGILPDMPSLENGTQNNPDGFGWAIVDNDRILVGHSLNADMALDSFQNMRDKYQSGPALFHSRIATAGTVTVDNVHPFYVGGSQNTVLAHNGILPHKAQPRKGDRRSDTRLLAERWLPKGRFGSLFTRNDRARLAHWLGSGNKVLALTTDPKLVRENNGKPWRAFLLNEQQGEWSRGSWYSNSSFEDWYGRYSFYGSGNSGSTAWAFESDYAATGSGYAVQSRPVCPKCESIGTVTKSTQICTLCYSCAVCVEFVDDCRCPVGTAIVPWNQDLGGDCAFIYDEWARGTDPDSGRCYGKESQHEKDGPIFTHKYLSPNDLANVAADDSDKDIPTIGEAWQDFRCTFEDSAGIPCHVRLRDHHGIRDHKFRYVSKTTGRTKRPFQLGDESHD